MVSTIDAMKPRAQERFYWAVGRVGKLTDLAPFLFSHFQALSSYSNYIAIWGCSTFRGTSRAQFFLAVEGGKLRIDNNLYPSGVHHLLYTEAIQRHAFQNASLF